jgi:serine/threonine protein kinase
MADSLFDNRYRYDYIYPRGRSGETLRAVDTLDNDRLVVVKRPAPNDAPPIRAGQEVSILNERKVLTRLAGHPILTALLGSGQFFVGGMPQQYIVIERGTGEIIANLVSEKAARDERLPELEMLIVVDALLDLLQAAHSYDIVYNDVDAKHLFWDRELYRLKVIDWGNAVFLEGDEVTQQGISRQSDVYQVGELLYFMLTGGGRPEVPRNAADDFVVDFRQSAAP